MSNAAYRTVKLHDVGDSAETSTRQPPPNLTRTTTNIVPLIRAAIINAIPKVNAGVRTRTFRQHAGAILTLFIFGLLPLTVYFRVVNTPFVAQPVSCGSIKEEAPGITGLFTIDRVPGNFPFWLAKLLDTIWDLFVARGLQFLAWCISYTIFSSALLRTIKASPIPYRTFIGISMNGASLLTIVSLLADLGRYSRKRTVWLFAYGALALTYVLAIPTLFSTMTGYVSVASPYIKLPVNSLFIPADAFEYGITFYYLPGVANASCVTTASLQVANQRIFSEAYDCNSTCTGLSGTPSAEARAYLLSQLERNPRRSAALYDDATCPRFRNESYTVRVYDDYNDASDAASHVKTFNCNDTSTITIAGHNFSYATALKYAPDSPLLDHIGFKCYNGTGYPEDVLSAAARCLPDGDSTYQWGFSSLLSSIVVIVHAVWALSIYAIWLDAEVWSELVRGGYRLTQLRGTFAVAAAAEMTTGLGGRGLLGDRSVERRLGKRGAVVERGVFGEAVGWRERGEEEEDEAGDGEGGRV